MTLPAIFIALLIALLIGAIYHILRGGSGWRLLMYLGLSIVGFAAGQFTGMWFGWSLLMVGLLNLGMGCLGSFLFLVAGDWLSRSEGKRERKV